MIILEENKHCINSNENEGEKIPIYEGRTKVGDATIDDARELHAMQVEAFSELLEKYQDFDVSSANGNVEK